MWEMSLGVSLPIKIHNEIGLSPEFFSWCKSKIILSPLLPVPGKVVACHPLWFLGSLQHCVYLGLEPKFTWAGTCMHTRTHTHIQNNNNKKNNSIKSFPQSCSLAPFFSPSRLYSILPQSQINPGTPNPSHTTLPCGSHSEALASVTRRGPGKERGRGRHWVGQRLMVSPEHLSRFHTNTFLFLREIFTFVKLIRHFLHLLTY